ncbi:hypothetical protein J6E82_002036 [Enterococcus faecium]|uniref:hypothetical protein n=1 Tax=Enterococcus faecium TaxID=1352 RepID=UPI001AE0CC67|nr:hypothetical protein [Enterococcus faecium]EHG8746820.1 hypothetical protein [Enterococcus faecium]
MFDWKKIGLKASVERLIDLVENHIGSNEQEAHKNATEKTAGFASPALFNSGMGSRIRGSQAQYESVFDIPAGLYETYADFNDLPDNLSNSSSIIQLKIERGNGERKQIWLTQGYTGTLWYYTMHTTSESYNPTGWTRIPRIEVIWEGDASSAGTKITTNQHMTHFKSLKIWYAVDDGEALLCKEVESNKSFVIREFDIFNGMVGANFFELRVKRNSNTELEINLNKAIGIGGKETTSNMKIRRIEGVA